MSLPCEMGCRREETDAVDTTLLQMSDVGPDMKSEDHVNVIRGDCRDVDVDERTDFVADCHTAVVVDVRQRGVMNECNRTIDDYLAAMDKKREKDMNRSDKLFMSGRGGMGSDAVVHHKRLREELNDRVKKTADFKVAIARLQPAFKQCDGELAKTRAELRRATDQGCTVAGV